MRFLNRIALFLAVILVHVAVHDAPAQKVSLHTAEQPLAPRDAAHSMRVPEGFRVRLYAGEPDVKQPIGFCIDDRNRLWVAEAYNYPTHGTTPGDRIVIFEDTDGDGSHDKRTVFYEGLNYVTGIEVGFGGVWVMSPPSMYFIPDRDGDDVPDVEPQVLLDGFGNHANAHNLANGFAWGPDGWLYATHGRTNWSMIGKPGADESERERFDGGVWRYHPVRHQWEPYADGTTNPWGIDWNDHGDAFVCNCVNPHLFQVIQGAHYEPWRNRVSSQYAYQRIDTIADHLHFVGLANVRNGLGSDAEDTAGGGHAHCGTMVYLGDNLPPSYRNQLFTNNIHGRRINNDLLHVSGSGYVASHGPDLMRSEDPWFMGVTLAYGAGGEIYASDWSDTGECHSTRDTKRDTGRIYRLTYLETQVDPVDLGKSSTKELVELQLHDNDWFVRHARRLLQQRSAAGAEMSAAHRTLRGLLHSRRPTAKRLRALWALHVTKGIDSPQLSELLSDDDPVIRSWAVTLSCEAGPVEPSTYDQMIGLANLDDSPRVRLALASALQRMTLADRWPLAEALAQRGEDVSDQNLPLMLWYGIEPLVDDDLERYAKLAYQSEIPRVSENMARRVASSSHRRRGLELLLSQVTGDRGGGRSTAASSIASGILKGLEGRRAVAMPDSWPDAYRQLMNLTNETARQQAIELAIVFQDSNAVELLKATALSEGAPRDRRSQSIEALVSSRADDFDADLVKLLDDDTVRDAALRGLARYDRETTPRAILSRYAWFDDQEKQIALQTLATRPSWARRLMEAVDKGRVPSSDLTAFTARQLRSLGDPVVSQMLADSWGAVRETPWERKKQIEGWIRTLTPEVLQRADLGNGAQLFKKHCAACHRFFGEGGAVGPDITGAQRTNIRYLMENIFDPSASVAKEFRMESIRTVDGRVLSGLVESVSPGRIRVINATDQVLIAADEIEDRKTSEVSVMPVGLLDPLTEREIRDLIGYLQR